MKALLFVLTVSMSARAAAPVTNLANFPNSIVYAVQTDTAGNIYVAGLKENLTAADPFVAKLSPSGQTLYSTVFAGTGSDFGLAWALALDSSGAAYVFGTTDSPDFPVTPGALQTAMQGANQGFVAKLDPNGKIVYCTFVGGATAVTPGLAASPGLDSILVDSEGDAIITGQAGTNSTIGPFPASPAPIVSSAESFVLKLDPTGAKILGAIGGIGGMIAMDSQGNIYVTGVQNGELLNPLSATPGAFQREPANVCGALGAFFSCNYPYVAKLNPGVNQVQYATYLSGRYGGQPVSISVDAQGDAFVVGTTDSPDYPTTPNAYEPQYIASAPPYPGCFFIINCVSLPPASGYLTEVNPGGTGLIYSSYFSGTQTDSINFAAFTSNSIYLGGSAGSADLPGFAGYPQQCLPQMYATHLSANATEIGASRVTPGKIMAYDGFAATLIETLTVSGGSNVVAFDPDAPQTPIACILDAADLKPITSVAPGELLSLFGEFSLGVPATPPPGQAPASLGGVTVAVNGIPSQLLYASEKQINFQAPFAIAGGVQANIVFASALSNASDSLTLPSVASNPTIFLNTATPSGALSTCAMQSPASELAVLPVALNPDGSVNTCLNPAPAGSVVTLFLNGPGVTSPPVLTATGASVVSILPLPGVVSGLWQVSVRTSPGAPAGADQISLTAGGVPLRDGSLIVWVL